MEKLVANSRERLIIGLFAAIAVFLAREEDHNVLSTRGLHF
jgi:hypothetical protein